MQEIEIENITETTEIKTQNKQLVIPVWERYLMTVLEASEYYHIGENKLRNVIDTHPDAEFLIMNGNRYLIKKKKFEEYLECATLL